MASPISSSTIEDTSKTDGIARQGGWHIHGGTVHALFDDLACGRRLQWRRQDRHQLLPGNILLGNGDGTFTAAANPPAIPSLQVVAAEFNGDGKIDLALIGFTNAGDYTPFAILLGNGDGTFTAAPNQPQFVASQLVAADFNGDGKIDLASINPMGDSVAPSCWEMAMAHSPHHPLFRRTRTFARSRSRWATSPATLNPMKPSQSPPTLRVEVLRSLFLPARATAHSRMGSMSRW